MKRRADAETGDGAGEETAKGQDVCHGDCISLEDEDGNPSEEKKESAEQMTVNVHALVMQVKQALETSHV